MIWLVYDGKKDLSSVLISLFSFLSEIEGSCVNDVNAERCRIGYEEQSEWYFFSHKDKKYPTGTRTNRATMAGFWKATGRDKAVYDKMKLIGMRKTLVFYKGRAPNGQKTDWIMHEYRLESDENGPPQASIYRYNYSIFLECIYVPYILLHNLTIYCCLLHLSS